MTEPQPESASKSPVPTSTNSGEALRGEALRGAVDVAVIGAGLAGLTAAALLARDGHRVTVIDRRVAGGRARSIERDGVTLNEGPHALYKEGRAGAVLRDLGIVPRGGEPPIENARVWFDGEARPLPVSPVQLLRSDVLGVSGKFAAARIMPALLKGRHRRANSLTLTEWLDDQRAPADLSAMIEMYVRLTTYNTAPDEMSASAAISQFALAQAGVLYLDGGWQQLVDGLTDLVGRHGGTIREGASVGELVHDGDRWSVGTDQGSIEATSIVIAAGGPATASRLVGEDPGWIEAAGAPSRVACLDVAVRSEPSTPVLLAIGDPLYGSTHAPPARLTAHGEGLVGVMRYLAPGEHHDRCETRDELRSHARRMNVQPDDILFERYLHEMVASHGSPRADRSRPRGDELAAKNVWVAGDWVDASPADSPDGGSGGSVPFLADAAISSAAVAARQIIERLERAR